MTKDTDQEIGQPQGKHCNKCGEWKLFSDFGTRKNKRNGKYAPHTECKACEVLRSKLKRAAPGYVEKEREANRVAAAIKRATDEQYVKEKNEKNRIYAAARRRDDPEYAEKMREYSRIKWSEDPAFRDKRSAKVMEWVRNNRERHRASADRRRTARTNSEGFHTGEDIARIHKSQDFKCVYCGTDTSEFYEVDHIFPLSRGGSSWPDNLQILCSHCNRSKRAKTDEEFRKFLQKKSARHVRAA